MILHLHPKKQVIYKIQHLQIHLNKLFSGVLSKKFELINEKQDILEKIRDFEQKGNNWLEPMSEVLEAITEVIGLPTHPLSANSKYGIVAKWDLAEVNIDKLIILFEKLSSVTT